MALLSPEECNVDVCVLGTGLTETVAAAAFARLGRRVLHIDREVTYGGSWRAFTLPDLQKWASEEGTTGDEDSEVASQELPEDLAGLKVINLDRRPSSCFPRRSFAWNPYGLWEEEELEEKRKSLAKTSSAFSVDLVPRLLFGRGEAVDVLVESGVARYLEFQGLKSARVLTSEGLVSVPLTKSDIFQDATLTLPEKRTLMRFVTSMTSFVSSLAFESPAQLGVDNARKVAGPSETGPEGVDPEEPWKNFLSRQKLSPRLQEFITYAIILWDWSPSPPAGSTAEWPELSTGEALKRLGLFISSLGMYGRGTSMPLLYPIYGVAEIAQGFTRMAALHHATYALRTYATHFLAEPTESGSGEGDDGTKDDRKKWKVAGLITQRGEVIRSKSVISSCDHFLQDTGEKPMKEETCSNTASCRRITVLLDCPLLGIEGVNLCVAPPGCLEPVLGNVVQVLQLDASTGSCPRGHYIAHLSQAWMGTSSEESDPFDDLQRVLDALLEQCGGKKHCLFRCSYLHRPRSQKRWDAQNPDGEVLETCATEHGLKIVCDPGAVPQLVASTEVGEARELFLSAPVPSGTEAPSADDFLKKPAHVAEEERGNLTEELEQFTGQMQQAQEVPPVLSSEAPAGDAQVVSKDANGDGQSKEPAEETAENPKDSEPKSSEIEASAGAVGGQD
eukprot:TRINITY_DN20931_c1_g1_i1.p1 TRINITY_DN20931_c1_g1~~TRINITY_DN20931_c1_g1_i1.p1  ORF type:complete len:675 (-),score=127.37 TRINITY_DN20931_c1_g1_i1:102-2126(-)